jgi:putative PIN family toxin of toxin-antitoxin system
VFLDTNVLVAAFAARGLCADVMRVVLAEHDLLTGEVVLAELRDVLERRLKLPEPRIVETTAMLRTHEVVPKPQQPSEIPVRHRDDRWALASAIAAQADVLVSGDLDLLTVARNAPIPVLSPRGFWDRLRGTSDPIIEPESSG